MSVVGMGVPSLEVEGDGVVSLLFGDAVWGLSVLEKLGLIVKIRLGVDAAAAAGADIIYLK